MSGDLFSHNPNDPQYYFPVIIGIFGILGLFQLFNLWLRHTSDDLMDNSLNLTLTANSEFSITFITNKNSLKFRYITAYMLMRASVWAKSPYIWSMYLYYHKFTVAQIGVLYIIDGLSALIFGPIIGNLTDKFGRKKFCQFYNISVVLNLALRLSANHPMAYVAQVITGIGAGLANVSFESWVVSESIKEFRTYDYERERFLKKLFKTINMYDAFLSIAISIMSAVVYNLYGILAPIILSILFSLISVVVIQLLWSENEILIKSKSISSCYAEAFTELKKREVFSVGVAESVTLAVQNLFLFLWTPVLIYTYPDGDINIGFIYICLVASIILGTSIFEVFIIYYKVNLYYLLSVVLFAIAGSLSLIYCIDSFMIRLILFATLNGLVGLYNPLFSFIKYKILDEKHRALLMNIFRIPLNIYVVICLSLLKLMDPFKVCLIAAGLGLFAFFVIISLIVFRPISVDGKTAFKTADDAPNINNTIIQKGSINNVNFIADNNINKSLIS